MAKTVEVFWLHSGSYISTGPFGLGDTVRSRVLPGLALTVQMIFETDE